MQRINAHGGKSVQGFHACLFRLLGVANVTKFDSMHASDIWWGSKCDEILVFIHVCLGYQTQFKSRKHARIWYLAWVANMTKLSNVTNLDLPRVEESLIPLKRASKPRIAYREWTHAQSHVSPSSSRSNSHCFWRRPPGNGAQTWRGKRQFEVVHPCSAYCFPFKFENHTVNFPSHFIQ